jgi:hypothetical protein
MRGFVDPKVLRPFGKSLSLHLEMVFSVFVPLEGGFLTFTRRERPDAEKIRVVW